MITKFFMVFGLLCFSTWLNSLETKLCMEKVKRHRFSDLNASFQPVSKRIDKLIKILQQKNNKVKEELIQNEILETINSIHWPKYYMNSAQRRPVYWYSRQG